MKLLEYKIRKGYRYKAVTQIDKIVKECIFSDFKEYWANVEKSQPLKYEFLILL